MVPCKTAKVKTKQTAEKRIHNGTEDIVSSSIDDHNENGIWWIQTLTSGQKRFVCSSYDNDDDDDKANNGHNTCKKKLRYFRVDNVEIFPNPSSLRPVTDYLGWNHQPPPSESFWNQFQKAQGHLEQSRNRREYLLRSNSRDWKLRPKAPPQVAPGGRWYQVSPLIQCDLGLRLFLLATSAMFLPLGPTVPMGVYLPGWLYIKSMEHKPRFVYGIITRSDDGTATQERQYMFYNQDGFKAFSQDVSRELPEPPQKGQETQQWPKKISATQNIKEMILMPHTFSPLGYECYIYDQNCEYITNNHESEE